MGNLDGEDKVLEVEFNISMHCNACERKVAKVISKIKGVERFITDMRNHRVIITGRIDPEKALKKLKKKTGKKVEIVKWEEEADAKEEEKERELADDEAQEAILEEDDEVKEFFLDLTTCDEWCESHVISLFSDENANACVIM